MRHLNRMVALAATTVVLLGTSVSAATIFTNSYDADALPENSTPPWQKYYDGSATVSGGILTITTTTDNADPNRAFLEYRHDDSDATPSWIPTGAGSTVEIRVKTDANAPNHDWAGSLLIGTGTEYWGILIGEHYVSGPGGDYAFNTADGFHTFRFTVSNETDGKLSMYVDGDTTPADSWDGTSGTAKRLAFGSLFSASQGQVEWDYIRWTNDGAFAPTQVPEPALLSIAALGALPLLRRRRR